MILFFFFSPPSWWCSGGCTENYRLFHCPHPFSYSQLISSAQKYLKKFQQVFRQKSTCWGLSCWIMSLWAASPYFLLVWIWLLLLVKQSHITCTVGNVQLLITHLCLHSEPNDLKNCGLKWKGKGGEDRHIRKKRGSGMHSKLRNLNFPDHLKWGRPLKE